MSRLGWQWQLLFSSPCQRPGCARLDALLCDRPWDDLKPYRVGGPLRNGSEEHRDEVFLVISRIRCPRSLGLGTERRKYKSKSATQRLGTRLQAHQGKMRDASCADCACWDFRVVVICV